MYQYVYCLAHPEVLKICEGNPKKFMSKGLRDRLHLEFVNIFAYPFRKESSTHI
jgi:hypothetical protein